MLPSFIIQYFSSCSFCHTLACLWKALACHHLNTFTNDFTQFGSTLQDFVNFHGQTLMLVHWSILAYTSVLKILKKHHKRTGLQVQEFSMQQLLSQPFCSVEVSFNPARLQSKPFLFDQLPLQHILIMANVLSL